MTNSNQYLILTGTCPDCRCPIYFDSRDGEPVPHECMMETENRLCNYEPEYKGLYDERS